MLLDCREVLTCCGHVHPLYHERGIESHVKGRANTPATHERIVRLSLWSLRESDDIFSRNERRHISVSPDV